MKNFKFIISYDGSRYFGWERQPGRDTIQGKLEAVLTRMCGTDVQVIGAGRTDAGVHAKAMAANAYMDTEKTPEEIRDYMNRYLPDDICVQEAKLAADRFHARYRAVGKLYTYTCYVGDTKPVFNRKYVTVLDYQPDLAAMQRAASAKHCSSLWHCSSPPIPASQPQQDRKNRCTSSPRYKGANSAPMLSNAAMPRVLLSNCIPASTASAALLSACPTMGTLPVSSCPRLEAERSNCPVTTR